MIYRTDDGRLHEVLDWKLRTSDRKRVQLESEESLRAYLKGHPGEDFFLIPAQFFNRLIQGQEASSFNSEDHIRCGIVRYDSALGKIVTRDSMKATYTDRAKDDSESLGLLEQATARLAEVLGPSAPWVMAVWDRTVDVRGRRTYTLRLSDWEGSVSATFTSEELKTDSHDNYAWRRLWGDLLQIRSGRQLSRLTSGAVPVGESYAAQD